jgi:hypothetical protein
MKTICVIGGLVSAVLLIGAPSTGRADSYWEVESARANARAGGPVSERDKELLERYGCLSGTDSAFCRQLRSGNSAAYRANKKRKD